MANVILGSPIYSDVNAVVGPSLAGGSWALPLANLQDPKLALIARSTSAALKDTRFSTFLGIPRRVAIVALPKHTLSRNAKARVVGLDSDQFYLDYEAGMDIATIGGTFVRATPASYYDQNSVLKTAAAGELRDSHFISGNRTVLLETAGANNCAWSEDLTNAVWTKANATVTPNCGLDPTGTGPGMDALLEDGTNTEHYAEQAIAGYANGAGASGSVFAAPYKVRYKIRLSIVQRDNITVIGATFDVANGVVSNVSAGIAPYMERVGGVYRCGIYGVVGVGGSNPRLRMHVIRDDGAVVYAGTAGQGMYFWGMQFEPASHYTSYMPTAGSTGVRDADQLTFPAPVNPQMNFSLYLRAVQQIDNNGANYFVQLGGSNPMLQQGCDNAGGDYIVSRFINGAGAFFDAQGGATPPHYGDEFEINTSYGAGAGSLQTEYTKNSGAITGNATSGFAAPAAWGAALTLFLAGSLNGWIALRSLRITGGATLVTERSLVYDSGWLDVWPVVYPPGSLPADDPRMVDGKYSAEEALEFNVGFTLVLPVPQIWTHVNVQISDAGNVAGHVDLARLAICGGYQPSLNLLEGAKIDLLTASSREETDGGAAIFDEKPVRRAVAFTIEGSEDEMLVNAFDMKRRLNTTRQLMFVWDGEDTYHMPRRSFLGVPRELTGLEAPYTKRGSAAYAVIEEL